MEQLGAAKPVSLTVILLQVGSCYDKLCAIKNAASLGLATSKSRERTLADDLCARIHWKIVRILEKYKWLMRQHP
jgi:hypothetical protein